MATTPYDSLFPFHCTLCHEPVEGKYPEFVIWTSARHNRHLICLKCYGGAVPKLIDKVEKLEAEVELLLERKAV